jgi:hypothetical protein
VLEELKSHKWDGEENNKKENMRMETRDGKWQNPFADQTKSL